MNAPIEHDPRRRSDRGQDPSGTTAELEQASSEPLLPSRSARKRQALALQELGVSLTRLKPAQLQRLALPDGLLAAVLEAQQLKSRAALARQRQYIGKLMRSLDAEAITRALSAGSPRGADDKLR